jgi:hypothetical protein
MKQLTMRTFLLSVALLSVGIAPARILAPIYAPVPSSPVGTWTPIQQTPAATTGNCEDHLTHDARKYSRRA